MSIVGGWNSKTFITGWWRKSMYEEFGEMAAIITGAGRPKGIGQAIARRFASEGTASGPSARSIRGILPLSSRKPKHQNDLAPFEK